MKFLDLSNGGLIRSSSAASDLSPAENLALDEALLRAADGEPPPNETLRIWEESCTTVILGRSSRRETEVNLARCEALGVPVLRRCSGGCSIVAGPGCLMYSVVLDLRHRPELRIIDQAHEFVLRRTLTAIKACGIAQIRKAGQSDLVIESHESTRPPQKFSGNSLRITRDALLYHGTILYDFPITAIAELLFFPPREPGYRDHRDHSHFVTNLLIDPREFVSSLRNAWNAREPCAAWPIEEAQALLTSKYATVQWNCRH